MTSPTGIEVLLGRIMEWIDNKPITAFLMIFIITPIVVGVLMGMLLF